MPDSVREKVTNCADLAHWVIGVLLAAGSASARGFARNAARVVLMIIASIILRWRMQRMYENALAKLRMALKRPRRAATADNRKRSAAGRKNFF